MAVAVGHVRAYPRGRGGACACASIETNSTGLSPRTRGSPLVENRVSSASGPIPADAGEPWSRSARRCWTRAYPRGRGGAFQGRGYGACKRGLSPRTRGSRVCWISRWPLAGPIPADAGEPRVVYPLPPTSWAYPRGRGGASSGLQHTLRQSGLSPRTRGSPMAGPSGFEHCGPIPADAGEPSTRASVRILLRAYPRGRGGAFVSQRGEVGAEGLSPRTRGSPVGFAGQRRPVGPIPADAGEPYTEDSAGALQRAYPRGRGGALVDASNAAPIPGLSPRTRGSLAAAGGGERPGGPIPADAGEPACLPLEPRTGWAYPRGRGGATPMVCITADDGGLSPRTRGSPQNRGRSRPGRGPIPADAGEPSKASIPPASTRAYPRGRGGAS